MTLKKCDRCERIFKPDDHATSRAILYVHDGNHTSWPNGKEFDYCKKCTVIIEKSLRNKS